MINKRSNNLLLFSLFGIALWFFGNLYEAVVIAPNLLKDSIRKTQDWQDFFTVTNPVFFYIPVAPIAILIIVFLYFKTAADRSALKKHLKHATIAGLLALILGVFIIVRINIPLFFGDIERYAGDVYAMSVLWNILNLVRVALLGITLFHVFNVYMKVRQGE